MLQQMGDETEDVVVRFVLPSGKTEATCSDDLSNAFDLVQESGMGPQWAKPEEVLEIIPSKKVNRQGF